MRLLSYSVTTGRYAVSTITRMELVQTDNMLIIRTRDPMPLRTDNATIQKLWVRQPDGTTGWLSVTRLRVGDSLFNAIDQSWTMVTSIEYVPGSYTMYDIYNTSPYNYLANNYLDPIKMGPTAAPAGSASPSTVGLYYTVRYTYNGEFLNTVTYPDGVVVQYGYDGLGRVRNVTRAGNPGTLYAQFAYNPNDLVTSISFGNGLTGSYSYDKLSRPSQISVKNGGTALLALSYAYNKTGTVSTVSGNVTSATVNEQYSYDALQRLVNSLAQTGSTKTTLSYSYDSVGNRLSQTVNGTATSYLYNTANNELTSSSSSGITASYSYDANGNLATKTLTSSATYTWDPANHRLWELTPMMVWAGGSSQSRRPIPSTLTLGQKPSPRRCPAQQPTTMSTLMV
jgi:YD repeat-containing protein